MNITELVGKRLLLKVKRQYVFEDRGVTEYRLMEISPSKNWAKLRDLNGHQFWIATNDIAFVEELRDLRAERMAERETLR